MHNQGNFRIVCARIPGSGNRLRRPVSVVGKISVRNVNGRSAPPPPRSSGQTQVNADIRELKHFDRGHLVALELNGLDTYRQIVPMNREFNESGWWRQMELAVVRLLQGNDIIDINGDDVPSDVGTAQTTVALTLGINNTVDLTRWTMEVHCFYEDTRGDRRVPVWFYVRVLYNNAVWTHFSLPNRASSVKTLPTNTEQAEFQAATDIYRGLSATDRGTVVNPNWAEAYGAIDNNSSPPNQILQFMHDVNAYCGEQNETAVFSTMQVVTLQPRRAYDGFQRKIFRKYNYWRQGDGELHSDVANNNQYPGELADIYQRLDEGGGRDAPEVDHILPSRNQGPNSYLNGRLVSFLHNHLYRDKVIRGSVELNVALLAGFSTGASVGFQGDTQYMYAEDSNVKRCGQWETPNRAIWFYAENVVDGTITAKDFFDRYFVDTALFKAKRALKTRTNVSPYKSVVQLIQDRQAFLKSDDKRVQRQSDEQALQVHYQNLVNRHAAGLQHFIDDQTHAERIRLRGLVAAATVPLASPSFRLRNTGGLTDAFPNAGVYVPISANNARNTNAYRRLMVRWRKVEP